MNRVQFTFDDGEPITYEWVEQEFNTDSFAIGRLCSLDVFRKNRIVLASVCENCSAGHETKLTHIKTRGDLRRLLAALGWRGEEKG